MGDGVKPNTLMTHLLSAPWFHMFSYLHTKTSKGSRVLGVMIQGATLNTTLSVKMGVSGTRCQHRIYSCYLQFSQYDTQCLHL